MDGHLSIEADGAAVTRIVAQLPEDVVGRLIHDGERLWYPEADAAIVEAADPDDVRPRLVAYAASRRYALETGGIAVGGVPVLTDRASQAMITGAFALVQDDPAATIRFKGAGGFIALDAEQMLAIGRAVGAHVQACFAAEADVLEAIEDGTITTTAAVDAAFAAALA